MPFLMIAWGFIQRCFSAVLEFCSKPPGSWIAAALGLVVALWWSGQHEFNRGAAKCEAAHAEAAANELARQRNVFIEADTRAVARSVVTEKKNTENKKVVADVKQMAAAQPTASDVCIDPAIADKLRGQN